MKPKKEGRVNRILSVRWEAAAERQAEQEKEAWENRIAEVARTMKRSAFDMRTWELERPKQETMVKLERAAEAARPKQEPGLERDSGPMR